MREGWTYVSFGDIMTPAKVERCGDRIDLPILSITMRSGIILQNDRFKKKIASFDTKDYKIVKNGQLVIAFPIDEGLIYTQDITDQGIMSPAYSIWDVDYSNHNRRFLGYLFHSPFAMNYYKSKLRGTTQRRRMLPKEDLLSFPIPVPPLSEQQRIVSELDLLSSIIEKKKAQLKEYDQLAQSIFYDMFGDPVTNEKGWEVAYFGDIASFKNGLNYHPKEDGFQIKCIGVGDFQDYRELRDFKLIKDYSIDEVIDESYYLKDGDIIIVRSNGSKELVGRNMIVYPQDKKVTYSGFCIRCRLNSSSILPVVLNRILSDKGTMMVLRQEGRGCNISNINQKILSSLPIILPPLPLQQSFASKIEAIERQKALIQQSIAEVQMLFDSRMDDWFA